MAVNNMKPDKLVFDEALAHFAMKGDRIKMKDGNDAHSSYDVLRGPLTLYAYSRVGRDWQDAEDCVQDAYVKVLETAKPNALFNFGGLYKIWLDRAIRDKRIDKRRMGEVIVEDQEVREAGGLSIVDLAESEDADPELLLQTQDLVDDIMELSNSMQPKAKAIARLSLIFGYTNKEVAQMLELPVRRVENSLAWFKQRLETF